MVESEIATQSMHVTADLIFLKTKSLVILSLLFLQLSAFVKRVENPKILLELNPISHCHALIDQLLLKVFVTYHKQQRRICTTLSRVQSVVPKSWSLFHILAFLQGSVRAVQV